MNPKKSEKQEYVRRLNENHIQFHFQRPNLCCSDLKGQ